ncbi:NADP-dependent oxidoreductase domain-containing protein [Chytriomyces sp. MP71]|nr:NADP-dependent oxidoreductase domain-containing protein [Chytriomyces sp. MP71]
MAAADIPDSTAPDLVEYVRLGKTGLRVSRVCLGCMAFGSSKWQKWVLDKDESLPVIKRAYDLGINFFDTADAYSNGQSELILGEALRRYNIPRDQVVIATKVYFPVSEDIGVNTLSRGEDDPSLINRSGLSRKHIFEAVEASLKRLGVSYIDLYQIHRFDYNTEIEETMEALNDLVRMGKVRYLGASSMYCWQFAKMNHVAELRGWSKFVTMQNFYNLLYREEEREMIKYCTAEGIAVLPWSPLARGLLAHAGATDKPSLRANTDAALKRWFPKESEEDGMILDRVKQLAAKRGVATAVVALAWLLGGHKTSMGVGEGKGVSAVIAGVTKPQLSIKLYAFPNGLCSLNCFLLI